MRERGKREGDVTKAKRVGDGREDEERYREDYSSVLNSIG